MPPALDSADIDSQIEKDRFLQYALLLSDLLEASDDLRY